MEITFKTTKLEKEFNDNRKLQRSYGAEQAKRIRRRMDDLRAASNLGDFRKGLPGRCHALTGDREGQLALDLVHPHRLVFEPANDPLPSTNDGGLDWDKVTAVRILEVTDYHGD